VTLFERFASPLPPIPLDQILSVDSASTSAAPFILRQPRIRPGRRLLDSQVGYPAGLEVAAVGPPLRMEPHPPTTPAKPAVKSDRFRRIGPCSSTSCSVQIEAFRVGGRAFIITTFPTNFPPIFVTSCKCKCSGKCQWCNQSPGQRPAHRISRHHHPKSSVRGTGSPCRLSSHGPAHGPRQRKTSKTR